MKDAFAGGKNLCTKNFIADRENLKNIVHIEHEIEEQIKGVINAANGNAQPAVEIGTWDAILLWLYHIPLLSRLVEFFGSEVVQCAREVDKLETQCKSWQKYNAISESVNKLIFPSA